MQKLVIHPGDYWGVDEHRVVSLAGMHQGFAVAEKRYPPEDVSEWGEYAVGLRKWLSADVFPRAE